jgi:hypothetical protein
VPSRVLGGLYFTEAFKAGRTQSAPAFRVNGFTTNNLGDETYCHYYTAHPPRLRLGKVKYFLSCPSMRIEGCRLPSTARHAAAVEPHPRPSLMPTSMIEDRLIVVISKDAFLKRAASVQPGVACALEQEGTVG